MASKFLFVIFLAKLIEPREVGLFGLLAVSVGYAIYVLGFEFYSFSVRELLDLPQNKWSALIRDQAIFYAFTYVIGFSIFNFFLPSIFQLF